MLRVNLASTLFVDGFFITMLSAFVLALGYFTKFSINIVEPNIMLNMIILG